MACLARLFKAIESFAEHAYKQPIWIITTVICGSCLTFIASYQSSRPEKQARFENAINERRVEIEDSERFISLYKEILAERESTTTATGKFSAIIDDIRASGQWTGRNQQIEENYRLAVETRKQVEFTVAKLQGTNFRVPYLNEYLRATEGTMKTDVSALKLIEDLCATYLTGDVQKFVQQILQSEDRINGIIKEQNTSLAQMESQSLQMESAIRLKQLELKRAFEQDERHRNIGILQIPAVIFSVGYIRFIFRGVRKFWTKPSRVILRKERVVSIPKKRRKKR